MNNNHESLDRIIRPRRRCPYWLDTVMMILCAAVWVWLAVVALSGCTLHLHYHSPDRVPATQAAASKPVFAESNYRSMFP